MSILQVLEELVPQHYGILDAVPDLFRKGPGLSSTRQSVGMRSEEGHHAAHLKPSHRDLVVTRVSIEPWNIAAKKRQAHNRGGKHLLDCEAEVVPVAAAVGCPYSGVVSLRTCEEGACKVERAHVTFGSL